MTDNSTLPPPGGPASPATAIAQPGPEPGRAVLAAVSIIAGSAIAGLAGGLIWGAFAPRVVYQMAVLNPPTAYAVNPETSAFIAADAWYCFIAIAGGALIGLVGYVFGVRRYGALPMAAVVVGSTVAAFITEWVGHQQSGGPGFNHVLATSKVGTYLHAPISLGSHGALAFWPLAAAAVAGGFELFGLMRTRRQPVYAAPMPGIDSFGLRPGWPGQVPGSPAGRQLPGPDGGWPPAPGQAGPGPARSEAADGDPGLPGR